MPRRARRFNNNNMGTPNTHTHTRETLASLYTFGLPTLHTLSRACTHTYMYSCVSFGSAPSRLFSHANLLLGCFRYYPFHHHTTTKVLFIITSIRKCNSLKQFIFTDLVVNQSIVFDSTHFCKRNRFCMVYQVDFLKP